LEHLGHLPSPKLKLKLKLIGGLFILLILFLLRRMIVLYL
jgi:hypothetical protein